MKPCIGTLKTVMTNDVLFQGRTGIAVQKFGYAGASREGNLFRSETKKLRFYVGHDGSMIRLAVGLGLGRVAPLRWPAMGSEIVMEVRRV